MKLVDITVREQAGIERCEEPIRFGVPVAAGNLPHGALLCVRDGDEVLPVDTRATQYWPDGSVRWCLLDVALDLAAKQEKRLTLSVAEPPAAASRIRVEEDAAGVFRVITDAGVMVVDSQHFQLELSAGTMLRGPRLTLPASADSAAETLTVTPCVEQASWDARASQVGVRLQLSGSYNRADGVELCRFEAELMFGANGRSLNWAFTLHNPRAATHPGGLWDLGDPASLNFTSLVLPLAHAGSGQIQLAADAPWLPVTRDLTLYQASSGGAHWDHRNHVDASGQVRLPFQGYRLSLDGRDETGTRADPVLLFDDGLMLYPDRFWQNFPKAVRMDGAGADFALWPDCADYQHELQPGERKTHRLRLQLGADPSLSEGLRCPPQVGIPPGYIAASRALNHFSGKPEPVARLIDTGLDEGQGFLAKRELIDEYGWRNFGDIFADHESLYLPPGEMFISHYNNQYDPIYGFIRQYLLSGDPRWWQLAEELAWHVVDIDIYSTQEDRVEYNGGLFWHTDHYVDAFTASHRTYSRWQQLDGEPMTQGGGPGAEHCYTHGLMLYHCLTGNARAREAVLQLTHWITHFYEGSGTVLETVLDIRSRILPRVRHAADPGRILDHRYPLNRGVGNYIMALLDSLALTNDRRYLQQAEAVISGTFSPEDDIADRQLDAVEETWFYTIFLQAVTRYLEIKVLYQEQTTAAYQFALRGFMKYALWLSEHEQPYLQRPDILDYPNDTWAAQDLRKAFLLAYAAGYCDDETQRQRLQQRADEFYYYVVDTLGQSETLHYARIQAILMQNEGAWGYWRQQQPRPAETATTAFAGRAPYQSRHRILLTALRQLLRQMLRFSLRRELTWLGHRHGGIARLQRRLYHRSTGKGVGG
ncbi:MAG: hypothetical protein SV765_07110 [Pseudomonadota bacterium]|nr:hypothetical protein [Pseudomonadota bacterium]